jgi:hypothetical protein
VGILQRVADEDTVLIVVEHHLLFQQDAADAIERGGNNITVKLADVLVTLRAVVVALILVESKIELCTVLNYRTVKRREQYMILVIQLRYGNHEQTVVLTGVAIYKGRRTVGTGTVCPKQFTTQRLLQIGHHSFLKS